MQLNSSTQSLKPNPTQLVSQDLATPPVAYFRQLSTFLTLVAGKLSRVNLSVGFENIKMLIYSLIA
tara:strand:+ start:1225 stop:1422 length:198 start_codon:yes stop_codon:yes gene_type:complete